MDFLELGQAVKLLRTQKKIPQQLMAQHLDISRATLKHILIHLLTMLHKQLNEEQ